jgi:hypothetical protein
MDMFLDTFLLDFQKNEAQKNYPSLIDYSVIDTVAEEAKRILCRLLFLLFRRNRFSDNQE